MIVYKYPLEFGLNVQKLLIPSGACPLTVQLQNGEPVLWVKVNPDAPAQDVLVQFAWTGKDTLFLHNEIYVGTVQSGEGLVWHLFWMVP